MDVASAPRDLDALQEIHAVSGPTKTPPHDKKKKNFTRKEMELAIVEPVLIYQPAITVIY